MRNRYKRDVLKTVQVLGEKIEIMVNSDGEFTARAGADWLKADTLKGLTGQLRKAISKSRVKVAIPATLLNVREYGPATNKWAKRGNLIKMTCKRVTLTGFNPSNNDIHFTYDDTGQKSTVDHNNDWLGRQEFARPMTPEEIVEWERLYVEERKARDAFQEFEDQVKLKDPLRRVREAMGAAVDDPDEPPVVDDDDPRPLVDTPPEDPV